MVISMANSCNFYTFYACPNSSCIYLQCGVTFNAKIASFSVYRIKVNGKFCMSSFQGVATYLKANLITLLHPNLEFIPHLFMKYLVKLRFRSLLFRLGSLGILHLQCISSFQVVTTYLSVVTHYVLRATFKSKDFYN